MKKPIQPILFFAQVYLYWQNKTLHMVTLCNMKLHFCCNAAQLVKATLTIIEIVNINQLDHSHSQNQQAAELIWIKTNILNQFPC